MKKLRIIAILTIVIGSGIAFFSIKESTAKVCARCTVLQEQVEKQLKEFDKIAGLYNYNTVWKSSYYAPNLNTGMLNMIAS